MPLTHKGHQTMYCLVNYAIASDGGSIALFFEDEEGGEYTLSLDKGIESKTKGEIFDSNMKKRPISLEE